jgi:hypothetical protein
MPHFLADVLTWPGNRAYITAIKAARDFSIPPTVLMLRDRQPSDGWSTADKKLAVAFQILEDETCPECGVPIWVGHSDDENVVFEVKSRVCYSCAEIETEQDREANRKNKRKPTKGEKHFVTTVPNEHIPSREAYYLAESEKFKE